MTPKQLFILFGLFVFTMIAKPQVVIAQSQVESAATIAVASGYSHKEATKARFPESNILSISSVADVVLMVMSGRADYGVFDLPVARSVVENNLDLEVVVDSTLFAKQIVAGFNPNNSSLLAEFNLFIKEFSQSDIYKDIIFRWQDGHGGVLPNIPTLDKGKILKVGVDSEIPPYCVAKRGELHGISVEIIKHFALRNGYQIRLYDMSAEALEASLASKRLDISLLSYAEAERQSTILHSFAYYSTPVVMVSRVEKILKSAPTSTIYSIEQLSRSTIAVAAGSSHDYFVTKYFPEAEIIRVDNFDGVYPRVRSQNVHYGVLDMPLLMDATEKHRDIDVVDTNLFTIDMGIAFAKDNRALCDEFNLFYRAFKGTENYKDMVHRWLVDGSGGEIPHIEVPKSKKILRLGTCTKSPPNALIIDHKIEGFEIELMRHFALQKGYELRIIDMSIGLTVPTLESGRIDAVAAGLCITEDRERIVLFSEPHQKIAAGVFQVTDQISEVKQSIFTSIKESFYNNIIQYKRYEQIGDGLLVTIKISLLSILLGSIIGGLIFWGTLRRHKAVRLFCIGYISTIKGIPVLVLLMLNFYLVFSGSVISPVIVAVITLGVSFSADLANKLRTLDNGSQMLHIRELFAPTHLTKAVSLYKSEAVSLIKTTSVVGYIAVEDITRVSYVIRSGTFDAFFPLILTAVIYFVLSYLFSLLIDGAISLLIKIANRNIVVNKR